MIKKLILIGFIGLTPVMANAAGPRSFCQFWSTGERMDKFDFFISRAEPVRRALIEKNPDRVELIDRTIQCYIENTEQIVDETDKICLERGNDDKVLSAISAYINGCLRLEQLKEREGI